MGCDFFFSSRRRHTRCSRDWSSDVCSSDLGNGTESGRLVIGKTVNGKGVGGDVQSPIQVPGGVRGGSNDFSGSIHVQGSARSEERRVGTECRSLGASVSLKYVARTRRTTLG